MEPDDHYINPPGNLVLMTLFPMEINETPEQLVKFDGILPKRRNHFIHIVTKLTEEEIDADYSI